MSVWEFFLTTSDSNCDQFLGSLTFVILWNSVVFCASLVPLGGGGSNGFSLGILRRHVSLTSVVSARILNGFCLGFSLGLSMVLSVGFALGVFLVVLVYFIGVLPEVVPRIFFELLF